MKKVRILGIALFLTIALQLNAQKSAPENWFNLDNKKDKVLGMSTEKAYKLLKNKTGIIVIVAVIDSGVDEEHEDLKDVMWVNKGEVPGNNKDDDNNGYIDDVYGWNFIGGKDGNNVKEDNLELTRVYRNLKAKYDEMDVTNLSGEEKSNYEYFLKIKAEYLENAIESKQNFEGLSKLEEAIETIFSKIDKGDNLTVEDISAYIPTTKAEAVAVNRIKEMLILKMKPSDIVKAINGAIEHVEKYVKYSYNLDFDPRYIVGDNYDDINEKYYGNNDVTGSDAGHGTHVSGIIAAKRNNNIGMNGVCENARIMSVRCVPDGDERDKDVANSIIYAVDNGAKVINMSFGKSVKYNKAAVDAAVKYAASKDVLLVHAAGNDAKNLETETNFPNPIFENTQIRADNWIEVGASNWQNKKYRLGDFSNYGITRVDVFAPGVDIYSTVPDSKYDSYNGTSMAAPSTAGVAALIRSYYPNLTAAEVRTVIMKSVTKVKGKVLLPGSSDKEVELKSICVSGGIVNAKKAVKLARKLSKSKAKA